MLVELQNSDAQEGFMVHAEKLNRNEPLLAVCLQVISLHKLSRVANRANFPLANVDLFFLVAIVMIVFVLHVEGWHKQAQSPQQSLTENNQDRPLHF